MLCTYLFTRSLDHSKSHPHSHHMLRRWNQKRKPITTPVPNVVNIPSAQVAACVRPVVVVGPSAATGATAPSAWWW